jgi:hypothetical protein
MHRILMIVAGAVATLLGSPTIAAAQDTFCADLHALTVQTDGFVSLRGAKLDSDQTGDHPFTIWASTRSLAGALRCEVMSTANIGGKYQNDMGCYFAGGPTRLATVRRLATAITACIGSDLSDVPDYDDTDDMGEIEFKRPAFQIVVLAVNTASDETVVQIRPKTH